MCVENNLDMFISMADKISYIISSEGCRVCRRQKRLHPLTDELEISTPTSASGKNISQFFSCSETFCRSLAISCFYISRTIHWTVDSRSCSPHVSARVQKNCCMTLSHKIDDQFPLGCTLVSLVIRSNNWYQASCYPLQTISTPGQDRSFWSSGSSCDHSCVSPIPLLKCNAYVHIIFMGSEDLHARNS